MAEEAKKLTFLYLGQVEDTKKKMVAVFYPLKAEWMSEPWDRRPNFTDDDVVIYDKKVTRNMFGGRPGTIWTVESPSEGKISPSTFGLIGKWPVNEHVMQWQAEDEVRRMTAVTRKETSKVANDRTLEDALEPLRKLYHSSVGQQRVMLIARVVAYITGGPLR